MATDPMPKKTVEYLPKRLFQWEKLGMCKIFSNLFIGSGKDSRDEEQMLQNNISHVVRIGIDPLRVPKPDIPEQPQYLYVAALDHEKEDFSKVFSRINDFIHEARIKGGHVLIHCNKGISRSVTLLTIYLMTITNHGWKDCLRVVEYVRKAANPNRGFMNLLQKYEKDGTIKAERQRFRKKFESSDDQMRDDEKDLKVLLEAARKEDETAATACKRKRRCRSQE